VVLLAEYKKYEKNPGGGTRFFFQEDFFS